MKEDLKLDVAIQVISNRLAEAMKNEDRKKITELLKLKKTSISRKSRGNRYAYRK